MIRKLLLLLAIAVVGVNQANAQGNPMVDYVLETRGDTLVIADYFDAGGVANTLGAVLSADTVNVPAGRVYMLHKGSNGTVASGNQALYLNDTGISEKSRPLTIVGEYCGQMVQGKDVDCRPPTLSGWQNSAGQGQVSGININDDLTLKNLYWTSAHVLGNSNWSMVGVNAANLTVTWENVMMEHNLWTFINSGQPGLKLIIKDNYLLNATDQPSRRNGGVFDGFAPQDQVWVENTTHLQNQGMQYKFRGYSPNLVWYNHNTFVNAAGQLFLNFGYLTKFVVTNNLFVNSNYQPYWPGLDRSEMYPAVYDTTKYEPHGIINLDRLPVGEGGGTYVNSTAGATTPFLEADRQVLVQANAAYWDAKLLSIAADLNAAGKKGDICLNDACVQVESLSWVNGAIVANDRTVAMFADDATWPKLTWEDMHSEDPGFVNLPDMSDALYEWGYSSANSGVTVQEVLPKIRNAGNEAGNEIDTEDTYNWIVFDWPVAVDLAYTNATYLTAGLGNFPLGDLNWFPAQKTNWLAQSTTENNAIMAALAAGTKVGTAVEEVDAELPTTANLKQNYPNPFNPTTTIEFELAKAGLVQLSVFDVLGRRVATLVNENMSPGTYRVDWNASNELGQSVASGMYFYTLRTGNLVQSKQMVLVK